jgi:hypothetical protein
LIDYPAKAFCFQVKNGDSGSEVARNVFKLIQYFLDKSIAHNIFLTRGVDIVTGENNDDIRILIWPRKSCVGMKQLGSFNVAVCELSGWFPVYGKYNYF